MEHGVLQTLSETEKIALCQEKFDEQREVMQELWPDHYVAMIMGIVVGHHADLSILKDKTTQFYPNKSVFIENVNFDRTNPDSEIAVPGNS